MRKIFLFIAFVFSLYSCNHPSGISIKVEKDSVINVMQGGIGCNMHAIEGPLPVEQLSHALKSYGGSAWGANPPLEDTAAWNKLFEYADWLGFDWCRLGFQYSIFEPQKDKFTFDGYEMKVLCRYLDYFQSRNINVFLQHYWMNVKWLVPDSFHSDPRKVIRSAPKDIEAYTDGFVKLLKYLIEEKKYTCIKQFCITNEPFENWSWYMKSFNPEKYESPAAAYKLMAEKIRANNIPVLLSGPDCSIYAGKPMSPQKDEFFQYFGAYDLHSYVTRFDWNPDSVMIFEGGTTGQVDRISLFLEYLKGWEEVAKKDNKPFFITELGTMANGFGGSNPGVAMYKSLLKDVQFVLRFSQAGLDGFARWNFVNRGNLDGPWQMVDTWDTAKQAMLPVSEFKPHANNFYLWGLLTRFTAKGSNVLKTTVDGGSDGKFQRVFATAYSSPEHRNYSVFIMNDSDKDMDATLNLGSGDKKFFKYEISEAEHKDKADVQLIPLGTYESKDEIKIRLKSMSLVLFTTYDLKQSDKGIIED